MNILVINSQIPMPDKASGELRFFHLLTLIAKENHITFCPYDLSDQIEEIGENKVKNYAKSISSKGVLISKKNIHQLLNNEKFDVILFEFYYKVDKHIKQIRLLQPKAIVVVDSVDVHFNRHNSKALLTRSKVDKDNARKIKYSEISAYKKSDIIITVTNEDKLIIKKELPDAEIAIIPNIHYIPNYIIKKPPYTKLIFVGSFKHDPNVDAITYFVNEVLPLLNKSNSKFTLDIYGPNPPDSIKSLENNQITIHGFVESLENAYRSAHISIAPLRYGGGMKGKIGEAMSYGIPVVTTDIGAEGFDLTPNVNIVIANDKNSFADAILRLSQCEDNYNNISSNSFNFINRNFSVENAANALNSTFFKLKNIKPKKLSHFDHIIFLAKNIHHAYMKRVGWRF